MTFKQIISELNKLGDKDKIILKQKKFGIVAKNSLGIYHNDLKELAKLIDKDNQLATQLFDSGIYEARILCSKLYNINDLTENLMDKWVVTFENWEVCDTFCMGLFAKSKFAVSKAIEWTDRKNEFEKRDINFFDHSLKIHYIPNYFLYFLYLNDKKNKLNYI